MSFRHRKFYVFHVGNSINYIKDGCNKRYTRLLCKAINMNHVDFERRKPMATTIAVAAQMLLLAAGLAEIYAMGNVAAGGVLLLASLFALGFAFGFGSGGE